MKWSLDTIVVIFIQLVSITEINAQIITTIAGGGTSLGDGGTATSAALNAPNKCVFDKYENFYFAEPLEGRIRKINTAGIITTIAGTGNNGYNGDDIPATSAEINDAPAIMFDANGDLYIADAENNRIRKVDITTGIITTVVGTGVGGYNGDNIPATSAEIYSPTDICFDATGNLYISDFSNYRIRKVDTAGIITTIAGTGESGTSGDGGPATMAKFLGTYGLTIDDTGNLYIADWDAGRVRKVDTSGIISTYAGTGSFTYNGDNISATASNIAPLKITFNNSNELCIVDDPNDRIRLIDNSGIIHTIAGKGTCCYSGDNGPADSAEIGGPGGIAFDTCGNLYISQVDTPRIRKVAFNPYCWPFKAPQVITNDVVVYPNPVIGEITITNVKTESSYAILNITGIIEQTGILKQGSNEISVQSLPPGHYLLELIDDDGNKTMRKIVKE